MNSYQEDMLVERAVRRAKSANKCGMCGGYSQKICWNCFDDIVRGLEARIEELEKLLLMKVTA